MYLHVIGMVINWLLRIDMQLLTYTGWRTHMSKIAHLPKRMSRQEPTSPWQPRRWSRPLLFETYSRRFLVDSSCILVSSAVELLTISYPYSRAEYFPCQNSCDNSWNCKDPIHACRWNVDFMMLAKRCFLLAHALSKVHVRAPKRSFLSAQFWNDPRFEPNAPKM